VSDSNFIDHVKVFTKSGNGGPGSRHFHRDKRTCKGGPDGGDGGRGGHIILQGNENLWTLLHLRYRKHIFAENGKSGSSSHSTGADGEDVIIEVPLGTVAKNDETGEVVAEVTTHGEKVFLRKGGRGGMGNSHFKSATHQTPRYAQPGEEGTEGYNVLELKILADVGLVGFPNAGKSTLLSAVSAARPKIADYAFTTLVPNVGIVSYKDYKTFVMADIPGIIEGAHEGKGLGLRFLRHIERNSVLLFLVPCDSKNIVQEYKILLNELKQYNPELLDKKRVLGISKIDMLDAELMTALKKEVKLKIPIVFFSAVSGVGVDKLKDKIWSILTEE
jgi:GTP-binding protein